MKFQQFMDKSLMMALYLKFHQTFRPLQSHLKNQGLNLNESLVLLALFFESSNKTTPTDLQNCLLIPKDQISQILKRLESNHWIARQIAASDKRKRQISLTARGHQTASQLVKIFNDKEEQLEERETS